MRVGLGAPMGTGGAVTALTDLVLSLHITHCGASLSLATLSDSFIQIDEWGRGIMRFPYLTSDQYKHKIVVLVSSFKIGVCVSID